MICLRAGHGLWAWGEAARKPAVPLLRCKGEILAGLDLPHSTGT